MIKSVLVTGASGFTGRYVCSKLKNQGFNVYALTSDLTISGTAVDIRDKDAVRQVVNTKELNSVVHLAAIANVFDQAQSEMMRINVDGTVNLLNALRAQRKIVNIIVASSANIYGNTNVDEIDESCPFNPSNLYAESKAQMEYVIREEFSDLPITIVRPFNYTGVGQSETYLVPKIVNAFKTGGVELSLGNINIYRDFSDIRFISDAYKTLVEKEIKGEVVNLCSGNVISIDDIIKKCSLIMKRKILIRSKSDLKRKGEVWRLCGNPTHMKHVLGYESKYSFVDTLSWMLSN